MLAFSRISPGLVGFSVKKHEYPAAILGQKLLEPESIIIFLSIVLKLSKLNCYRGGIFPPSFFCPLLFPGITTDRTNIARGLFEQIVDGIGRFWTDLAPLR